MLYAVCIRIDSVSYTHLANAENWNGLANYPEVPNSANGTETYFFDKASEFKGIDSSRNNVFGVNVINMHNNQYGEATFCLLYTSRCV